MNQYQIIDNIEVPASAETRGRSRDPFTIALDSLQIGQGFVYSEKRDLKRIYRSISPKKFPTETEGMVKKFKIWVAGEGQVGVKRLADVQVPWWIWSVSWADRASIQKIDRYRG